MNFNSRRVGFSFVGLFSFYLRLVFAALLSSPCRTLQSSRRAAVFFSNFSSSGKEHETRAVNSAVNSDSDHAMQVDPAPHRERHN